MSIHTVGDSHCYHGWNNIISHHLGSLLCYSFGKEKLNRIDIRKYNIKNGDTIVFCLGEIDCRCHIYKHVTDKITYENIIDNIVNDYIDAIELNINISQIKLKNVCIYNVVPPIQKHNTPENFEFPYLGTDNERKEYVLYFNKKLKEKCNEKNYIFFDIYDKYVDEYGYLNRDLSDGIVHIRDGSYINDFIKKNNL